MSYQDKTLTCVECGAPFVFTANEQSFYAERGFTNEPKRCSACRQNRKATRGGGFSGSSDSYGSSAGYASGGESAGGGYGGRREMHTVQCSACGGEARVPFVPRGDRPVYCSDCFGQQRGGSGYGRASRY